MYFYSMNSGKGRIVFIGNILLFLIIFLLFYAVKMLLLASYKVKLPRHQFPREKIKSSVLFRIIDFYNGKQLS